MAGRHRRQTGSGKLHKLAKGKGEGFPLAETVLAGSLLIHSMLGLLNEYKQSREVGGQSSGSADKLTPKEQDMNYAAVFRFTGGCAFKGVNNLSDAKNGGKRILVKTSLVMDPHARDIASGYPDTELKLEKPEAAASLLTPQSKGGKGSPLIDVPLDAKLNMKGEEGQANFEVVLPKNMSGDSRIALFVDSTATLPEEGASVSSEMFCFTLRAAEDANGKTQWLADPYDPTYFRGADNLAAKID